MQKSKYTLVFECNMIWWDEIELPMKQKTGLSKSIHNMRIIHTVESKSPNKAVQHVLKIFDTKFKNTDLPSVISISKHTPTMR